MADPPRRTASGALAPPMLDIPAASTVAGASDDEGGVPKSARMRSTRGRSQPFFIGVAGA